MHEVELTVPLGTSLRNHSEVGQAIAAWLTMGETAGLAQPVRLSLRGGAYLSSEETADFWRELLPEGLVGHATVNGQALIAARPKAQRPRPTCGRGRVKDS